MGRNIRTGAMLLTPLLTNRCTVCFINNHPLAHPTLTHPPTRPSVPRRQNAGERERVSVEELGEFLVFTIADFCDQLMSWQVGRSVKSVWPVNSCCAESCTLVVIQ
jgi:hypothetical protein